MVHTTPAFEEERGKERVKQLTRSRRGKGKEWNEEKHLSGPANQ